MSQQYTCNSCGLGFPQAEDQRSHMKSDWHRYNLKRRVAHLPAISEGIFNLKVSNSNINAQGDDEQFNDEGKSKVKKQITKKEQRRLEKEALIEKKRRLLETAKQKMAASGGLLKLDDDGKVVLERASTGINSDSQERITKKEQEQGRTERKEQRAVEEKEEQIPDNEFTEEQLQERLMEEKFKNRVEIPLETCLFCNKPSETLSENIEHMFRFHGLYIPETNYLVDKEGLIKYLSEKIGFGNVCLSCNFQGKNLESIRQHMLKKAHCRIPYESEDEKLEISDFYDFRSTYSNASVSNARATGEDEGEWEDVSDDDDDDEDDEVEGEGEDEEFTEDRLYSNGYELHLPNGQIAGHRSLARYYRQSLKPDRELSEGQGTLVAAETRHFVKTVDRKEVEAQKRVWVRESKANDRNDRRAAKFINNQPHYRDQLLQ